MGDKQPKCFVPECNNCVGVLFPKSPEVKKRWLKALGLDHQEPGPKSFVCLDHFQENGQPGIKKKSTSTPQDVYKNSGEISSFSALQQRINKIQKVQVEKKYMEKSNIPRTYGRKRENANSSSFETEEVSVQEGIEEQYIDTTVYSRYEKICRLCMTQASNAKENVFNKLDANHTIAQVIAICLHPLKVLPNDNLSKNICTNCIRTLKSYYHFHENCIAVDAKQRELVLLEQNDHVDADCELSDEYLHEERLSDYEENKENKDGFRKDNTNGQMPKPSADPDKAFNEKSILEKVSKFSNISVKRKYDKDEEELLKVLEGSDDIELKKVIKPAPKEPKSPKKHRVIRSSISESNDEGFDFADDSEVCLPESSKKEGDYTEDIIIEMVNDEESQSVSPVSPLLNTSKLPITIKRVQSSTPQSDVSKRKRSVTIFEKKKMTVIKGNSSEEIVILPEKMVVLPSGISVAVRERYQSVMGFFRSEIVTYLFDSEFLLAGGYLYEFRLVKNNVRRLHCIVNKCPARASQIRLQDGEYSEDIEVAMSHNHDEPDHLERKRQMFYHILYGKMRRDKNFNFKILYEQFCKLDPSLSEILPLRGVIREICKQGPAIPPPTLRSFDDFYEYIENDDFHKVHFTDNRVQFYQEKFETEDGAKAVVFGNQEVIEGYSYSKLMYVDASFVIDSSDFPNQLVTVLVWVDQGYYPILYAFVNMKSQALYKKILTFLYSDLAPNLRPHEIITDYEANLYYALGETYIESSIGGSMFYFTQNIYKKICSLNLARELELNSNFRSIYNMLLMLPLLPVNTIIDGLNNIEVQAKDLELESLTDELFAHVHNEWICRVTPELFCVHRLENRINENIVAPFKKLRDLIMLSKNKSKKVHTTSTIINTIEKLMDLEKFLRDVFDSSSKKSSFTKDLSSSQKKIILKAWNYIENHPMININQFFLKVLGYIKCMENQLWIWGFYRYGGATQDILIDANNFSIVNQDNQEIGYQEQLEDEPMEEGMEMQNGENEDSQQEEEEDQSEIIEEYFIEEGGAIRKIESRESTKHVEDDAHSMDSTDQQDTQQDAEKGEAAVVMEAVMDENGSYVLQDAPKAASHSSGTNIIASYVYK